MVSGEPASQRSPERVKPATGCLAKGAACNLHGLNRIHVEGRYEAQNCDLT
jgi:hypothetical protein